jgi:hypothetical protein
MAGYYRIEEANVQAMSGKLAAMSRELNREAPDCETSQKHLDPGTVERAYWHYGYICGARDVLALVERSSE